SAVGLALACRLGRNFVDVDASIEADAGRPVAAIFTEEGEAGFREREREAIAEATKTRNAVIACGGGAGPDPANGPRAETHGPHAPTTSMSGRGRSRRPPGSCLT